MTFCSGDHVTQADLCVVFPPRKFYTEQMFVLLRTKRMQQRNHADTQTLKRSQRWKGYATYIYIYRVKFRMSKVRGKWDSIAQIVWWHCAVAPLRKNTACVQQLCETKRPCTWLSYIHIVQANFIINFIENIKFNLLIF